ncbi:MAG TPA: HypC/HybG/HupF family hydrogenase formation chaperone, partial [Thermoanaerobaculia bacterium]|nr:HypC/HybG/HupF family hydrogenase formation chaperone [Thermoanaerobaculia bacterium]
RAANREGLPFVLSGGCFQNALLAARVLRGLRGAVMNRNIPPGDGGLAAGQAVIASALSRQLPTTNRRTESTCA